MVWYFEAATYTASPPPTAESETMAAVRRVPIFMGFWPFALVRAVRATSIGGAN
jgi:hypothetical protein